MIDAFEVRHDLAVLFNIDRKALMMLNDYEIESVLYLRYSKAKKLLATVQAIHEEIKTARKRK